jgi:hypothetical protein
MNYYQDVTFHDNESGDYCAEEQHQYYQPQDVQTGVGEDGEMAWPGIDTDIVANTNCEGDNENNTPSVESRTETTTTTFSVVSRKRKRVFLDDDNDVDGSEELFVDPDLANSRSISSLSTPTTTNATNRKSLPSVTPATTKLIPTSTLTTKEQVTTPQINKITTSLPAGRMRTDNPSENCNDDDDFEEEPQPLLKKKRSEPISERNQSSKAIAKGQTTLPRPAVSKPIPQKQPDEEDTFSHTLSDTSSLKPSLHVNKITTQSVDQSLPQQTPTTNSNKPVVKSGMLERFRMRRRTQVDTENV